VPKRVIDFDAMWGSDKLASCAAWAQAEYAWLYGLADASGCFELTNLRVIWGRVAAVRGSLTIERLEQVFAEFMDKGLLFVWEHEGKRYAHWTGSDVPGRLPPPSWRMRLERFAPPVPKQQLAEYMAKFARGRAALGGVGFRNEEMRGPSHPKDDSRFEISDLKEKRDRGGPAQGGRVDEPQNLFADGDENRGYQNFHSEEKEEALARTENSHIVERPAAVASGSPDGTKHQCRDMARECGLKGRLEESQAQDLDWDLKRKWEVEVDERRDGSWDTRAHSRGANREKELSKTDLCNPNSTANTQLNKNSNAAAAAAANSNAVRGSQVAPLADAGVHAPYPGEIDSLSPHRSRVGGVSGFAWREKELAVARELRVGQGPVCGPGRVRPEVLERIRRREAARAGSRSP
jgi:hypothetical protein